MSRTSDSRKCEEAYAQGVTDGRESNILDRFSQSIAKDFSTTKEEKSYNEGYTKGIGEKTTILW